MKLIALILYFSFSSFAEDLSSKRLRIFKENYKLKQQEKLIKKNLNNKNGKFSDDLSLDELGLSEIYQKYNPKNKVASNDNDTTSEKKTADESLKEKYPLRQLDFDQMIYYHYLVDQKNNEEFVRIRFYKAQQKNNIAELDGRYDNTFQKEYHFKKKKFKQSIEKILRNRSTTPESFKQYTLKLVKKYFPFVKESIN